MREKEGYRLNLERISARFPGCDMLTPAQVAEFTGLTVQTVRRKFPFPPPVRKITAADFARIISSG